MSIEREEERVRDAIQDLQGACLYGEPDDLDIRRPIAHARAEYLLERLERAIYALIDERNYRA